MNVFDLNQEQHFDPTRHVERILDRLPGCDVSVACWEPSQISPYHCHPNATEIYFCFSGGGQMRTPDQSVTIDAGSFVVHPPGELHEYVNGPERTLLFRVRVGEDMTSRHLANRGIQGWVQRPQDRAYFAANPPSNDSS
ncbi:MAG: cupin domain-containing protein [Hyphomicrobiaceae bacterium]